MSCRRIANRWYVPSHKLVKALVRGVEYALLHDHGYATPKIKTGQVVIAPQRKPPSLAAIIEKQLAPERYVAFGIEEAPADRVRVVNDFIEERWTAVPAKVTNMADVANGVVPIAGFKVTQHVRYQARSFAHMTGDEIREHVMSLQQAPEDDRTYMGYYPTIAGNALAHHDPTKQGMAAYQGGNILRGNASYDRNGRMTHDGIVRQGTEIRGGRAELRRVLKQKNYGEWDTGWHKHAQRIAADNKAEMKARHEVQREIANKKLPQKLGEV